MLTLANIVEGLEWHLVSWHMLTHNTKLSFTFIAALGVMLQLKMVVLCVMSCIVVLAGGSVMVQQDAVQSEDDSVQKVGSHKFNFSTEFERSAGLR